MSENDSVTFTTSPVPNFGELFTGSMSEVPAQYPQLEPDRLYFGSLGSTSLLSRNSPHSTQCPYSLPTTLTLSPTSNSCSFSGTSCSSESGVTSFATSSNDSASSLVDFLTSSLIADSMLTPSIFT